MSFLTPLTQEQRGKHQLMRSEALSGAEVCDCCPSEIILNGSDQALLFRDNNANLRDMWASFSSDGGGTFPIGGDVDDAEWLVNAMSIKRSSRGFY